MSVLGHTHYHWPSKLLFTLGECETCGRPVQEPNAVKALFRPNQLKTLIKRKQLTYYPEDKELPPEVWWDDYLGCTICERPDCKETV